MELIKQIKEAEAKAKQLVQDAQDKAMEIANQAKTSSAQMLADAQKQRFEAIDQATEKGSQQGQTQSQSLKESGTQQIDQLRQNAKAKMPAAVDTVVAAITAIAQED